MVQANSVLFLFCFLFVCLFLSPQQGPSFYSLVNKIFKGGPRFSRRLDGWLV